MDNERTVKEKGNIRRTDVIPSSTEGNRLTRDNGCDISTQKEERKDRKTEAGRKAKVSRKNRSQKRTRRKPQRKEETKK